MCSSMNATSSQSRLLVFTKTLSVNLSMYESKVRVKNLKL